MKLFLTILLLASAFAYAQKIDVPKEIKTLFTDAYPNAGEIIWTKDSSAYKVNFIDKENLHHIIVYDEKGKLIRNERELVQKDIPSQIQQYYQDKFPTEHSFSVWLVEDAEGNQTYYSNRKDETIYFDKTGQLTKGVAPSIH